MSIAGAVDTLAVARDLEAADIGRRQAEAIAGAMYRVAGATDDTLATKADLTELKTEFKADLTELRTEFKADLAALEVRLMRFYFGASVAQIAVIVGLLKLL